jgi:hypothetical protein
VGFTIKISDAFVISGRKDAGEPIVSKYILVP